MTDPKEPENSDGLFEDLGDFESELEAWETTFDLVTDSRKPRPPEVDAPPPGESAEKRKRKPRQTPVTDAPVDIFGETTGVSLKRHEEVSFDDFYEAIEVDDKTEANKRRPRRTQNIVRRDELPRAKRASWYVDARVATTQDDVDTAPPIEPLTEDRPPAEDRSYEVVIEAELPPVAAEPQDSVPISQDMPPRRFKRQLPGIKWHEVSLGGKHDPTSFRDSASQQAQALSAEQERLVERGYLAEILGKPEDAHHFFQGALGAEVDDKQWARDGVRWTAFANGDLPGYQKALAGEGMAPIVHDILGAKGSPSVQPRSEDEQVCLALRRAEEFAEDEEWNEVSAALGAAAEHAGPGLAEEVAAARLVIGASVGEEDRLVNDIANVWHGRVSRVWFPREGVIDSEAMLTLATAGGEPPVEQVESFEPGDICLSWDLVAALEESGELALAARLCAALEFAAPEQVQPFFMFLGEQFLAEQAPERAAKKLLQLTERPVLSLVASSRLQDALGDGGDDDARAGLLKRYLDVGVLSAENIAQGAFLPAFLSVARESESLWTDLNPAVLWQWIDAYPDPDAPWSQALTGTWLGSEQLAWLTALAEKDVTNDAGTPLWNHVRAWQVGDAETPDNPSFAATLALSAALEQLTAGEPDRAWEVLEPGIAPEALMPRLAVSALAVAASREDYRSAAKIVGGAGVADEGPAAIHAMFRSLAVQHQAGVTIDDLVLEQVSDSLLPFFELLVSQRQLSVSDGLPRARRNTSEGDLVRIAVNKMLEELEAGQSKVAVGLARDLLAQEFGAVAERSIEHVAGRLQDYELATLLHNHRLQDADESSCEPWLVEELADLGSLQVAQEGGLAHAVASWEEALQRAPDDLWLCRQLEIARLLQLDYSGLAALYRTLHRPDDGLLTFFKKAALRPPDVESGELTVELLESLPEEHAIRRWVVSELLKVHDDQGLIQPAAYKALGHWYSQDFRSSAALTCRAGYEHLKHLRIDAALECFKNSCDTFGGAGYPPALKGWLHASLTGSLWVELAEACQRLAEVCVTQKARAEYLHLAGCALMDKALAPEQAFHVLYKALAAAPSDFDVMSRLKVLHEERMEYGQLAEMLQSHLDGLSSDQQINIRRYLVDVFVERLERFDDAYLQLLELSDAEPTVRVHYKLRYQLSVQAGQWDRAVTDLSHWAANETDASVLAQVFYVLGELFRDQIGNNVLACKSFERSVQADPADEAAWFELLMAASVVQEWNLVLQAGKELLERSQDTAVRSGALHQVARAYQVGASDEARAERCLILSLEEDPSNNGARDMLVTLMRSHGHHKELAKHLSHVATRLRHELCWPFDAERLKVLARTVELAGADPVNVVIAENARELAEICDGREQSWVSGEPGSAVLRSDLWLDIAFPSQSYSALAAAAQVAERLSMRQLGKEFGHRVERGRHDKNLSEITDSLLAGMGLGDIDVVVSDAASVPANLALSSDFQLVVAPWLMGLSERSQVAAIASALFPQPSLLASMLWWPRRECKVLLDMLIRGGRGSEAAHQAYQRLSKSHDEVARALNTCQVSFGGDYDFDAVMATLRLASLKAGVTASRSILATAKVWSIKANTDIATLFESPLWQALAEYSIGDSFRQLLVGGASRLEHE